MDRQRVIDLKLQGVSYSSITSENVAASTSSPSVDFISDKSPETLSATVSLSAENGLTPREVSPMPYITSSSEPALTLPPFGM